MLHTGHILGKPVTYSILITHLPPVIIQGTLSQKIKAKLEKLLKQRLFLRGQNSNNSPN